MAVEDHPKYPAWNQALEKLVAAERRYHVALMENQDHEGIQGAGRDLDEAREQYRVTAEALEREARQVVLRMILLRRASPPTRNWKPDVRSL